MTTIVAPGRTFNLKGTLGSGQTLVADSGNPIASTGAIISDHATATNAGPIDLLAGPGYSTVATTGATLNVTGVLTNLGLIDASGGTDAGEGFRSVSGASIKIAHTGSIVNTGAIILSGATIDSSGSGRHGDTTGAVLRDNGTLINDGNLLVYGANVPGHDAGATLTVAGLLTNSDYIHVGSATGSYAARGGVLRVLSAGILLNDGRMIVGPASSGSSNGPVGAATLQVAGQLLNNGLLGLYEGDGRQTQGARALITNTGTISNAGTILIDGGFQYAVTESYKYSTAATLTVEGMLSNSGTINDDRFGNSLAVDGVLTNNGAINVEGGYSGLGTYARPASLAVSGTFANSGVVQIDASLSNADYTAAGATLSVTGFFENTGTVALEGAATGPYGTTFGALLDVWGVLTNVGNIKIDQGSYSNRDDFQTAATVDVFGTLTNYGTVSCYGQTPGYSGSISVSGVLVDPGLVTGYGTIENTGTILSGVSTDRAGAVGLAILNDGDIQVSPGGAFTINGPISGYGNLDLSGASLLTLDGSVGAEQTADFSGTESLLALGAPSTFYATIEGLRPSTTIDFLNTLVVNAEATGKTLAIGLASGGTLDFTLAAPLANYSTLALQSDLHGGTNVVVTGSGVPSASNDERLAGGDPIVSAPRYEPDFKGTLLPHSLVP